MVDPIIPVIFVAYILLVLGVGLYSGKGLRKFSDFSVMKRSAIGPLIVATMSGTIIGAGATLGTSGTGNTSGLTAILVLAIPWGLTLAATTYLGNPLWDIGEKANAQSLGDAAGYFYGKPTQLTVGLLGLVMTVPALGAQLVAAGTVFEAVLPITFNTAVIASGAVLILYSAVAGIRGVIITDWLQFSVLMLIIPGTALFLLFTVGIDTAIQAAEPAQLNPLGDRSILNFIAFVLLIFGSETLAPYYIGRLYAGDERPGRRGYLAAFTSTTYMISAVAIGFIGIAVLPSVTGQSIIPQMLVQYLPPWIGALGAAALFAVLMSSSDSVLNADSVIVVRDFYNVFGEPDDQAQLRIGRYVTAIIGVLAVVSALAIPGVIDLLIVGYFYWAPTVLFIVSIMLITKSRTFTPYTPPVAMLGTAVFVTAWFVAGQPYGLNPFLPGLGVNIALAFGYHYLSKTVPFIPSGEDTIGEAGTTTPAKGMGHLAD